MKNLRMTKFWEAIIKLKVLVKIIRSKWFYINILIILFAGMGFIEYRRFIYIPEHDSDYKLGSYSLGNNGERPFYQTEDDYNFVNKSEEMVKNRVMRYVSGKYYNFYKKNYKAGILYTQDISVTKNQLPEIYWMVTDACGIIGLENIPPIFISNRESSSIILTSYINPKIIIGSDFLWAFKPEELRYLLVRKLVHIKCNHTYLLDMVKGFEAVADSWIPESLTKYIFGNMGREFLNWYKEAQITADRGALAVTGNAEIAISALIKSNIGANYEDQYSKINPDELVKQLDVISSEEKLSKFAIMAELRNPTPFIVLRVNDLLEFYHSNEMIFK